MSLERLDSDLVSASCFFLADDLADFAEGLAVLDSASLPDFAGAGSAFAEGEFGFRSRLLLAVKLVKELFIEPKGLFPAIEFVTGLLRGIFARAEIKDQKGVVHSQSLRGGGRASQAKACNTRRPPPWRRASVRILWAPYFIF